MCLLALSICCIAPRTCCIVSATCCTRIILYFRTSSICLGSHLLPCSTHLLTALCICSLYYALASSGFTALSIYLSSSGRFCLMSWPFCLILHKSVFLVRTLHASPPFHLLHIAVICCVRKSDSLLIPKSATVHYFVTLAPS